MYLPYSPYALLALAKLLYPASCTGRDYIDIDVDGREMQLRILVDRGMGQEVEFMLHLEDAKYGRAGFTIYRDEELVNSMNRPIPVEDLLPDEEPVLLSIEELAEIVYEKLLFKLKIMLDMRAQSKT